MRPCFGAKTKANKNIAVVANAITGPEGKL